MSRPAPVSAASVPTPSASLPSSIESPSQEADLPVLYATAARLLLRAVPLVESGLMRFQSSRAHFVRARTTQITQGQAQLQSILALPVEARAASEQRKLEIEKTIANASTWLDHENAYKDACFAAVESARTAAEQPESSLHTVFAFGQFCSTLFSLLRLLQTEHLDQAALREWILEIDAMFTQLAAAVPRMQLSPADQDNLLRASLSAGALQVIPVVMRCSSDVVFPSIRMRSDFFLTHHCDPSIMHFVSRQPYFRLFEFGLDPAEIAEGGNPLSLVQIARNFVRDHPQPACEVDAPVAADEPIRSMLPAWAAQHREATPAGEALRRDRLHAKFMHALLPAWRAHSDKVRALLSATAPDRLIAPLVDIVSRYLDFEGVQPEPIAAPAEDATAAMS